MFLSRFGIQRPMTVFMIFIAVIVMGLISFSNLKIDLLPEMDFPMIAVVTTYTGVGPQEMESMVTVSMEKTLATVTDVRTVSSKSLQEISVVMLEFEWGTDMSEAAANVREKVDLIRRWLPEGVDNPMIIKFDPSMMPVMFMGISGKDRGLDFLRTFAEDKIAKRLERINGVASATVMGGLQREIQVRVDRLALEGRQLSLQQVMGALAAANLDLPGGHIKLGDTDYIVRVIGQFKTVDEIANVAVGQQGGVPIYVKDIAAVEDDYHENTSMVKINGLPGVLLQVQKASSSNTVEVAQKVREELKQLERELPAGVHIQKIMDQAEFIEGSISNVQGAALEGALLAIILILVFLGNWRSTFIVSLAIPISVIATFALLYFGKLTLNFATMGGLALGVGRLVDDAIVVLENIYRHMQAGERPREASLLGAIEVGKAVLAATFTTIVVFVPIFFVTGMAGVLFKPMAYTVSFSLLASLFVALMLIPVLTTKFLRVDKEHASKQKDWMKRFNAWFNRGFEQMLAWYHKVLEAALQHRKRVIWLVAGVAVSSLCLLPFVGMEFMPSSDEGQIEITFKLPVGTRLETSEKVLGQLEQFIKKKVPETESSFGRVGVEGQGMGAMASIFGGISGSHAGQLNLQLVPRDQRRRTTDQVIEALRPELKKIPGVDVKFAQQHSMSMSSDKPIVVEIQGYDLVTSQELAKKILALIETVPGVRDAEISREEGLPEMQIEINRERAAQFGLNLVQVAQAIETAMAGKVATLYRDPIKGEEYNVLLRYKAEQRFSMQDLDRIFVVSPTGAKVPIANLASVRVGEGPVSIDRKNQERIITVASQVSGRAPGDVAAEIQRRLRSEITIPDEFTVTVAGMYKDMVESFRNLLFALLLAVLLVYMVLVAQFESLLDPFIIMFSVPLGIVGVIWGLFLSGYTLSVISFLGIIMMAGIVVSNGILLVDFTNILRNRGKSLKEAIIEAAKTRMRPILMTSLTTVLGMLPMALGLGEGGETEAPMAISVIFGLSASMVMTLVFIPTMYSVFEEKVKRSFKISDEAA